MSTVVQYKTYEEFYPYYLSQHRHPFNRKLHFLGFVAFFGSLFYAIWYMSLYHLIVCPFSLLIFPFVGHYVVEKNKPLVFKYPKWTLQADFRLAYLVMLKKINEELEKYKIVSLEDDWKKAHKM